MKISFRWLKDYVTFRGTPEEAAEILTMGGLEVGEVETADRDYVLHIEITTNRPDWLSHIGVARELRALAGSGRFVLPSNTVRVSRNATRKYQISIPAEDQSLCPYYSACLLEDVKWGATPDFIKTRIEACGIRSINLPVDITNFVLLEYGQPLHAFDADLIKGSTIYARSGRMGEKLIAINGDTCELKASDIVIADASGPIALGGVMGGKSSEVTNATKHILLESAFFNPVSIRSTSRRLKLASESSYRFERRVDPLGVDAARERAIYLFLKHAEVGSVSPVFKSGRPPVKEVRVELPVDDVSKVLGVQIPKGKIQSCLKSLGLDVSSKSAGTLIVEQPSFRSDLTRPIDLIEEIARLYGYNQIPETLPEIKPFKPEVNPQLQLEHRIKTVLSGFGLYEAVTFTLIDPVPIGEIGLSKSRWVQLVNPQHKEWTLMRPTLLHGLASAVQRNVNAGESSIRLFEIGNRYLANGDDLPDEECMVAFMFAGEARNHWMEPKRKFNFYDLKGMVEQLFAELSITNWEAQELSDSIFEPGAGFYVSLEGQPAGFYGSLSERVRKILDLDQPVFYAEFSLREMLRQMSEVRFAQEIPKFPASPRDLTVLVPETVSSGEIVDEIFKSGTEWIKDVQVFDYFKGGRIPSGKKSLSFRIIYQSLKRTLQNEEVNTLHFKIVARISKKFQAELPSA